MLSEIAVTARARSPSVSWATLMRNVESTPPENATITLPISRRMARRRSSLASAAARSTSFMLGILDGGRSRGRLVARQTAELVVVDQLLDGRIVAADRAGGVA